MRTYLLFALIGVFSVAGTIAMVAGILFTIGGFAEEENGLTSWFGGFAGFILIGVAAVMYMAALLAYIAHLVSSAIDLDWTARQIATQARAPISSAPMQQAVLPETPRPPWYAQDGD